MIKFFIESDIHFTKDGIRSDKRKSVETMLKYDDVDVILCVGDLTDNGWDGGGILCWKYGGESDQLTPLKNDYIKPLYNRFRLLLCLGNHDYYVPKPYIHHPVVKYVKNRRNVSSKFTDSVYNTMIKDVMFICLGRYPDNKALKYFKKVAPLDKRIVIFFHYNLSGPYSEWWNVDEKDKFHDTIKGYNIVCIAVGHYHISEVNEWRGYKVVSGAGSSIALCELDGDNLSVTFV